MEHTFSIEEALKFGWHKTRTHSGILFQAVLTVIALQLVSAVFNKVLEHSISGIFASIIMTIIGLFIGLGFTIITLKIARGEVAMYSDIWPPIPLVWRYFLANLLVGLIVALGFLLLIVPGIYFALRYSMVSFAIIDGSMVMESLKKSTLLTTGKKWHLLGLFIVLGLVNLVGVLLLFVGLLVTIPITAIAMAHVYQKLHTA